MLLELRQLNVTFAADADVGASQKAVDGIDLCIDEAEVFGLVGESGSGKTVSCLAILKLVDAPGKMTATSLLWRDKDLLACSEAQMRRIRGREIAMIFQNPQASLNPGRRIGDQLCDVLRQHRELDLRKASEEALRLLDEVRIKDVGRVFRALPRELSGGMCQRVMIAMAISCHPRLLLADEPTASLDVTVQSEILDLLLELRGRLAMAILLVSHDLGVIARMCDRIGVMRNGRIVEMGEAGQIFYAPQHPYTQLLLQSILVPEPGRTRKQLIRPLAEPHSGGA